MEFKENTISDLILSLASGSQLLAHQFIWNMNSNLYEDESGKKKDKSLFGPLNDIINKVNTFIFPVIDIDY